LGFSGWRGFIDLTAAGSFSEDHLNGRIYRPEDLHSAKGCLGIRHLDYDGRQIKIRIVQ
jgi:hypothetical protein